MADLTLTKDDLIELRHDLICDNSLGRDTEDKVRAAISLALAWLAVQPRPLRELPGRVAVIERMDRDTDEPFHIILHKSPDGKWREAGAHISCGHFDDNEKAMPLTALPEPEQ